MNKEQIIENVKLELEDILLCFLKDNQQHVPDASSYIDDERLVEYYQESLDSAKECFANLIRKMIE